MIEQTEPFIEPSGRFSNLGGVGGSGNEGKVRQEKPPSMHIGFLDMAECPTPLLGRDSLGKLRTRVISFTDTGEPVPVIERHPGRGSRTGAGSH